MKKKFAVLGNPIRHSWSPFIHELFAKQFDLSISYIKVKVLSGSLNNTLQELIKQGFTGVNITVPLKKEAFDFASSNKCEITVRAKKANAVNTIFFDKQKFIADNTDGYGLIKSLEGFNLKKIKGGSILICGAGGATRGILPVFNKNNFKKITIINRSHTNLNMLSSIFSSNLFDYITIKDFKNNFSTLSKTEKRMFNYNYISFVELN